LYEKHTDQGIETVSMLYQLMLIKSEEDYSVSCPSLPGCHSQGETREEAIENIRNAIAEYKVVMAEMQAAG
jgi:predicted RNase H-like HicB family nuclease